MKRTVLFCDLHRDDEVRADETITFTTSDDKYEIDLCAEHVEEWRQFEAALAAWVASARSTTKPAARPHGSKAAREENQAIREWAPTIGITLGTRGRISDELRTRYRAEVAEVARGRWTDRASAHG